MRIIPADAGSTLRVARAMRCTRDHPRGCGEHSTCGPCQSLYQGSSPRMRGAPDGRGNGPRSRRIIPADAGSTKWRVHLRFKMMDHPRGCGEHGSSIRLRLFQRGSSPRMRGARNVTWDASYRDRIIPADAGSTYHSGPFITPERDHPRGCGEHLLELVFRSWERGSSPRMRGARLAGCMRRHSVGIIPADAGSTPR